MISKATIITIVTAIIGASLLLLLFNTTSVPVHAHPSRVDIEMHALMAALENYNMDFGSYPKMTNSSVYGSLSGINSRRKVYFEFPKKMLNEKTQIIDPWGTSYKFNMVGGYPQIQSAGENLHFESGGDDHSL